MTSALNLELSTRFKKNLRDGYQPGVNQICVLGELDSKLIESLRVRSGHEKRYIEYFFEIFAESINLPGRPWTVQNRAFLPAEARSPYLDLLAQTFEDTCQVSPHPTILDCNYYLYNRVGLDDESRWTEHLENIKAQKIFERERVRVEAVYEGNADVGKKNIVALLNQIAEKYGLRFEHQRKPSERFYLHRPLENGRVSLFVDDIPGIKKWGQLIITFEFVLGVENAVPIVKLLSASSVFPGGRWYEWQNRDLYDVHVSLGSR